MEGQDEIKAVDATAALEQVQNIVSPSVSITELRLQRIEDYQRAALQNEDPLEATVGAANGSLMRLGVRLENVIDESCAVEGNEKVSVDRLLLCVYAQLKLMRQVDRFSYFNRPRDSNKGGRQAVS